MLADIVNCVLTVFPSSNIILWYLVVVLSDMCLCLCACEWIVAMTLVYLLQEVVLQKTTVADRIGLTLGYSPPDPHGLQDVFIEDVEPDSIAGRDGRVLRRDLILQVWPIYFPLQFLITFALSFCLYTVLSLSLSSCVSLSFCFPVCLSYLQSTCLICRFRRLDSFSSSGFISLYYTPYTVCILHTCT